MDNIDQSQTNDPSAMRMDTQQPADGAAAPSASGTPESPAATSPAPQQEPAGEPAQAAAPESAAAVEGAAAPAAAAETETVVQVAGVAATAVAGDLGAAVQAAETGLDNLLKTAETNAAPVLGDPEFVRARLHAIERHALLWGGEVGAAIRNEATALMDHMGVPRPQ